MKNTFKWMLAAILICGLTVSSCKKEPVEKKTMMVGMTATGFPFYDSVTYSFEYDANYRIVRSEAHQTNNHFVIRDLRYTYSEGSIRIEGSIDGAPDNTVCTLDSQGRITQAEETRVNDTISVTTHYDFTYDADGHLSTVYRIAYGEDSEGSTRTIEWEADEFKAIDMEDGSIRIEYETSDVPVQTLFQIFDYDIKFWELCGQGCFGKTPAHMPSKRTMTTDVGIPSIPPIVMSYDYNYTIDTEGHLATCEETGTTRSLKYVLNWEER